MARPLTEHPARFVIGQLGTEYVEYYQLTTINILFGQRGQIALLLSGIECLQVLCTWNMTSMAIYHISIRSIQVQGACARIRP